MDTSGHVRRRLATITAAAGLLLYLAVGAIAEDPVDPPVDPPDCTASALLVNPCRPWLGASASRYPQAPTGLRQQVEYHEQRAGRRLDVVHAYHAVGVNALSADERHFATRPDTLLYLNWKPAARWVDAAGGNAAVDAGIDAQATSIRTLGKQIFLTVHHEPENDVSGTPAGCTTLYGGRAGTAEDYRAMWRNVRARFSAAGATNVVWVLNYMSYAPYNCMIDDLYPGNDLVDWVAFDNYGSGTADDFVANVGRMYDFLANSSDEDHDYKAKPWAIAEWNIRRGQVTPQQTYDYYDAAKGAVEAGLFPNIRLYMVWDSVTSDGTENRVGYQPGGVLDPVKQEHYTALAQSSAFGSASLTDLSPPTVTVTSPTNGALVQDLLTVNALVWDDVGVSSVDLRIDFGDPVGATVVRSDYRTTLTWDASGLGDGTHYVQVDAADAEQVTTSTAVTIRKGDIAPPSTPAAPAAALAADLSVDVRWAAASDDVGVVGYELWRNGSLLTTLTGLSHNDPDVRQGSSYSYRVYAVDAAGNRSAGSPSSNVIVVPDRTAPTAPTGLSGTTPAPRTVRLTWGAAVDNVAVTRYQVFRGSTQVATVSGTTLTATVTSGLRSGVRYSFKVRAVDAAGNVGPFSTAVLVRAT